MIPDHKRRIQITVDRELLYQLDTACLAWAEHRSTVLSVALVKYLDELRDRSRSFDTSTQHMPCQHENWMSDKRAYKRRKPVKP